MQGSLNLTDVQNSLFFFLFSLHYFWHLKHSSRLLLYSHLMDSFLVVSTQWTFGDHVVPIRAAYQIYPAVYIPRTLQDCRSYPPWRGGELSDEFQPIAQMGVTCFPFDCWCRDLQNSFPWNHRFEKLITPSTQNPQWEHMVPPHVERTWRKPLVL